VTDNLDPERALLGIILDRPRTLRDIEDLEGADFAQPKHEALWNLMQWMDSQRIPPEPTAVAQNLSRIDLPGVDTLWVHDLFASAPIAQPPHIYARMVRENATLRRLRIAGQHIVQLAEVGGDSQEIAETARAEVDASSRAIATVRLVGEEIDETLAALEEAAPQSIPTPWADLDYLIQGWRPGGLYVIGARPGVGKSVAALQAALSLAERGPVAFHSLEMPRAEVHTRMLAQMANLPMARMDRRELTEADWSKLAGVRERVGRLPLAIDDRGAVRVVDIRSHARTLSRRGPLAGIVVDYLQLMTAPRGDRRPRHEQVAEWSRQLKLLAKDLGVPVIALSQLNRQSEARQDRRPTIADLRESGAIEQDADVILLLHRDLEQDPTTMHILVAKNRQGTTNAIKLEFRGDVARLDPWQWRPTQAAS
jgi:replicative DNA helicase